MILELAAGMYGAAGAWRRRWYRREARRLRLDRPVVSVGNLSVGGSGKTPLVAHLAALLARAGERPVILSRGYGRADPRPGVTVVADRSRILAEVAAAGDEPLMLARMLPGIPVVVGASRYRAGRAAEASLDPTVHLLDDGFQHLQLARDVDLVVITEQDLDDRVLPAGRLREPLASAAEADAAVLAADGTEAAERLAQAAGVETVFRLARRLGAPRFLSNACGEPATSEPVFAVAGIARPERFFGDLAAAGWTIAGRVAFPDHHPFTARDAARIARAARAAGARAVVTTEKDAVRLERVDLDGMPVAVVPLVVSVEPADRFADWLLARLSAARSGRPERAASRSAAS